MKKSKNIGASNFRKLLELARKNNMDFNLLLKRYLQERFLYRLSISRYKENFISAYSLETIIAEKLEAMAKLLYANSRMKDFYDVYAIFNAHLLNDENLAKSIKGTFENRQTSLKDLKIIFSPEFYSFTEKQIQWTAFLNKNKILNAPSEFKDIVMEIEKQIKHVLNNL